MTEQLIQMKKTLLISLLMITTAHAQWEVLPPLPEPNGGFMCGHTADRIVIVGGTNWEGGKKNWLKTARFYDPENKRWTRISGYTQAVAYGVGFSRGCASFGFVGGSDGSEPVHAIGMVVGEQVNLVKAPHLPEALVLASGGWVDGALILCGGTPDAADLAGLTCLSYAVGDSSCERLADYPGKPFAVAASAVVGGELFVFGGMNYDEVAKAPLNSREAYAFSPESNTWRPLKSLDTPNRGLCAVALDDQQLYIAGGYTADFTAEAMIYDVKNDSYRKAPPLPYQAMVSLVNFDGFVYCLGGEDKKQSRTDKFYRIPAVELMK
jgi:N-acetylneuraminic acid mutarotase